jgi:hypothetical protein
MHKRCPMCYSTSFGLSKLRKGDVLRLLLLMYPVRCLECYRRSVVFLPLALRFKPARRMVKQPSA